MGFKEVKGVITRQISHMNFTFGAVRENFGGHLWVNQRAILGVFGKVLDNLGGILGAIFKAIVSTLCTLFIGILTQPALGSEYL